MVRCTYLLHRLWCLTYTLLTLLADAARFLRLWQIGFSNAIFCTASGSSSAAGAGGAAARAAGGSARGSAEGMRRVVRSHGGIENHGFRTLDMEWHEEQAWGTKGTATDVLGLLRLWAYSMVGPLQGRYLRAGRYRRLTLTGFVAWLEQVSVWGEARCRGRGVVPTR